MLYPRLNRLRRRLDALREGRVAAGQSLRVLARLESGRPLPELKVLPALDEDLDRVGIHTSADAKLLLKLGVNKGRAGQLAVGLPRRAGQALEEVEAAVRALERATRAKSAPPGALSALERAFQRLARAVKVADLFAQGDAGPAGFEIYARFARPYDSPPSNALVAIAELWLDRARGNAEDLLQKRRDLDAAHELLLALDAELERDRVRRLRLQVEEAREREQAAPAVRSLGDLVFHLRQEARRDPASAYGSMRALYQRAVEASELELAAVAQEASEALAPAPEQLRPLVEQAEWEALADLAFGLSDDQLAACRLAAGCARYFNVEDAAACPAVEARAEEHRRRTRRAPYPTRSMTFQHTNSLDELASFVISHPRRVLHDLAAGRQLVRAYLEELPPPRPRKEKKRAVRVYLCDASGSMHGPRARLRDAILLAELVSLRAKAKRGEPFDPLYFSFFQGSPGELARVDSAAEATRWMEKLFQLSPAEGETDITLALVKAFESIRLAQGKDPYLARATVVLVTDGEDAVELERVRRARAPLGQIEITLSFISLGEENAHLRSLVLDQRQRGQRAFYQHLSDPEISGARTEFDCSWRTLLPPEVPASPAALQTLWPHLAALEEISRGRRAPRPDPLPCSFDALFPPSTASVDLDVDLVVNVDGDGDGDVSALRVAEIVEAIAEAASLAPADQRATECASLLTHLLDLYGLSMRAYLAAASRASGRLRHALDRVRLTCRPFG